jgi:hypothetical protein
MIRNFFREYILKLVITVTVASTVTSAALIGGYWGWPNAVVGGVMLLCGVFYLTDRLGLGPTLRSRVRNWLDASGYDIRAIEDSNQFHFVVTDNVGIKTEVLQVKSESPIMIRSAQHIPTSEQLAPYKAQSEPERNAFWRGVRLELLRYGISFSDLRPDGEGVTFSDTIVVGQSFTGTEFLKQLMFVRSGARLYQELWLALYDDHIWVPPVRELTIPARESTVAEPKEVPPLASLDATAQVIHSSSTPDAPGDGQHKTATP